MKKYYLLMALIVLFGAISLKLNAQAQTVVAAASPEGIAFNGNDLYITEYSTKKIFKIDITANPLVRTEIVTLKKNPTALIFHNNALYVVEGNNEIYKVNLATKAETLLAKGEQILGMAILGDTLYFPEYTSKKISKVSLTSKVKTDFYTNLRIYGLAFNSTGSYLYLGGGVGAIKINMATKALSAVSVTPTNNNTVNKLVFDGDDLYTLETNEGTMYRIANTNGTAPFVKTELIRMTAVERPRAIAYKDKILYISEVEGNKVSKIDLTCVYGVAKLYNSANKVYLKANQSGATYQWVDCNNNNQPIQGATAQSYTPQSTGSYAVKVTTANCSYTSVCTSIIVSCNYSVSKQGDILTANADRGTYQWVDCNNSNQPIQGATAQSYTATINGSYAVRITTATPSCAGTSPCTVVTDVGCDYTVAKQGNTLTANTAGATYQWIDCNNSNKPIQGATAQSYTPQNSGSYAVRIAVTNCSEKTSICTPITLGLIESTFSTQVKIYPNPISDKLTIELGKEYSKLNIEITNILGQVILSQKVSTTNNKVVLPLAASAGIYFVRLRSKEGTASFRVVKK